MADHLTQTVRIVRQHKVRTDERGRTVCNVPIEEAELELPVMQGMDDAEIQIVDDGGGFDPYNKA